MQNGTKISGESNLT